MIKFWGINYLSMFLTVSGCLLMCSGVMAEKLTGTPESKHAEEVWGSKFYHQPVEKLYDSRILVKMFLLSGLGNLVMWDALRLYRCANSSGAAINNAISMEGAVWQESFFSQASVVYDSEPDSTNNITYTPDQLMRHSWAFWLQQTDHTATSTVKKFVNSRTGNDDALIIMKEWATLSTTSKYDRDNTAAYRTSESGSLPEFVPLMKIGSRRSRGTLELWSSYAETLNDPIGLSSSVNGAVDCNAVNGGWRNTKHSDAKNLPFYTMYNWYNKVFTKKTDVIQQ